jgi:putative spermidine/putrescine transport system substrate-binding protein
MEKIKKGSCPIYHANAAGAYFNSLHFWKTPISDCGNGQTNCTDYRVWQQKWTEVTG